jgi:predicted O-linked N-acetylglucosamine transferase (SPINDLY family)
MGVPVVSLRGTSHAGRMVASVLDGLGLTDLIAEDAASYVRIASELCEDTRRLKALRAGLRSRMEGTPIRDEAGFTRAFESACLDLLALESSRPVPNR